MLSSAGYYKARDANVFRVGKRRPIELNEPGLKKYLCVIFDLREFGASIQLLSSRLIVVSLQTNCRSK